MVKNVPVASPEMDLNSAYSSGVFVLWLATQFVNDEFKFTRSPFLKGVSRMLSRVLRMRGQFLGVFGQRKYAERLENKTYL